MPGLPLIRPTNPGIYQVLSTANTDYILAIPNGAIGLVLWFETSATDPTQIIGRIGVDQNNTAVTGITATNNVLGYHPAVPIEYTFRSSTGSMSATSWTLTARDSYVHIASAVPLSIAKGMWLFANDEI